MLFCKILWHWFFCCCFLNFFTQLLCQQNSRNTQQRVNTANPTAASVVSHRKAFSNTNCSSERQTCVRHDAVCWETLVLIRNTGRLCLTVDMDCTVRIRASLPSCPEWHPANMKEPRISSQGCCRVESSCMVETFLLTSFIIRHQLSDRRPLRFTVTRGAEDDGSKSHWEALGVLVVKGWPQWPAQDWSERLQLQAELEWRTRRTWPTWRWSRLRPLTDLRTEEETEYIFSVVEL